MKATKVRAGYYSYRGMEIENLDPATGDWNGYQRLWRVTENNETWYMHYTTLKAAKQAIDGELESR